MLSPRARPKLIALAGARLSGERDAGILRLIAAQPVETRTVAAAKFGSAALVAVTAVLAGTALALALNGALGGLTGWGMTLALLAAALAAYVVFWIAACALAASLWRGAVPALAFLVLCWACLTVALPATLSLAVDALAPVPSRIAAIDASRRAQDRFYNGDEGPRITAAWLAVRVPEAGDRSDLLPAPEIKRLARDAFYDVALAEHREAAQTRARLAADWSRTLATLSPATALALALETAAGSDAGRHAAFLAAVADYRQRLRVFFEPRILTQALRPMPVCEGCQARLDFDAYDAVPAFPIGVPAEAAIEQALASAGCILIGALALAALAYRRFRAWPV